jgi:type IV secretion system protein VirB3
MQAEVIYKGATRPAMKLGIPLVPLVVVFGSGMLLMMWGGILVSGWIALGVLVSFVPVLFWMRWLTSRDDQRFRQIFIATKLRLNDRNRRFWRARSYSPTLYRGASDVWHL